MRGMARLAVAAGVVLALAFMPEYGFGLGTGTAWVDVPKTQREPLALEAFVDVGSTVVPLPPFDAGDMSIEPPSAGPSVLE